MNKQVSLALIAGLSVLTAGGFLSGLWPYGIELGGIAGFAFLAVWYLRLDTYIFITLGLAICLDGLSSSPEFVHSRVALIVLTLVLGLRYGGFILKKRDFLIVFALAEFCYGLWNYLESGLSIYYLFIVTMQVSFSFVVWLLIIKFLPQPGEAKLFGR